MRLIKLLTIALCACLLLGTGGGQAYGATFGNTIAADDYSTILGAIEGVIRGNTVTLSEDAVLTSITAYLNITTSAKRMRCMVYKESDTSLVAATEVKTIPTSAGAAFTFNFNYAVDLVAGNYILCCYSASGTGVAILGDAVAEASDSYKDNATIGAWPPDPTIRSEADATTYFCIYCTYEPGATNTFGRRTIGASTSTAKETIVGGIFTTDASDTTAITAINAHFTVSVTPGEIDTVRALLYKESDLSYMDTTYQILIYADSCVSSTTLEMWRRFTFPTAIFLAKNTQYVLCLHGGNFSSSVNLALSSSGGEGIESDGAQPFDNSPPNPLEDATVANWYASIFAEFNIPEISSGGAGDTTLCFIGNKVPHTSNFTIENRIVMHKVTATASATLYSMQVRQNGGLTGTRTARCAVYKQSDTTLVDTTEALTFINATEATGQKVYLFPTPKTITSGTDYFLAMWGLSGSWTLNEKLTTTGGSGIWYNDQTYTGQPWPTTLDASVKSLTAYRCAIVLYYTCPSSSNGRRRRLLGELDDLHDWNPLGIEYVLDSLVIGMGE